MVCGDSNAPLMIPRGMNSNQVPTGTISEEKLVLHRTGPQAVPSFEQPAPPASATLHVAVDNRYFSWVHVISVVGRVNPFLSKHLHTWVSHAITLM